MVVVTLFCSLFTVSIASVSKNVKFDLSVSFDKDRMWLKRHNKTLI